MAARVEGNVLTLPAVRHEDAGVYACAAANRRGQETAYYVLKVRGEDGQMDRWVDRLGGDGCDVPPPLLTPSSLQSAWCPISGRRPAPSSPCPPSRMPTRGLRSSSPSDLTPLTVSADGTPCPRMCPHVPPVSPPCFPLPSPLPPSALLLYSTRPPPALAGFSSTLGVFWGPP